jgi:hypothetical protein
LPIADPDPFKTIFTCNLTSQEGTSKELLSSTTLHPPPAKIKLGKQNFICHSFNEF